MARGWESKSVEAQQQAGFEAQVRKQQPEAKGPDPAYLELIRKRETLILSRTRVMRELASTQNPRYRQMLANALAALNTELSELSKACSSRAASA